ncbi:Enkurin domain-containing protein [Durusdinium trenchii]|uniref:Enkurin domain-containing protein n=1 Tax=Durusdinium trenchii TaxID=1381693 RepID=A0ABP0HZY0_9DINO
MTAVSARAAIFLHPVQEGGMAGRAHAEANEGNEQRTSGLPPLGSALLGGGSVAPVPSKAVPYGSSPCQEDLGEPFHSLPFLEVHRRSAKWAAHLKAFLRGYEKPSLARQAAKKSCPGGTQTRSVAFQSNDELEQLLKAEQARQQQRSWIPDLRRAATIDDLAANEINRDRCGEEAITLTSDLNPLFADALVRFGALRNEVMDRAQDRREKADRLLSHMTNQVRYGIKKKLRSATTPQTLPEVEESSDSTDVEELETQHREKRLQRRRLRKSVAKFDRWMADYLHREGLKPAPAPPWHSRASRPSTAPAVRPSEVARGGPRRKQDVLN